jgi:hypothetical protein
VQKKDRRACAPGCGRGIDAAIIRANMSRLLARLLMWFLALWMPIHAAGAPLMLGHCESPLNVRAHGEAAHTAASHEMHASHEADEPIQAADAAASEGSLSHDPGGSRLCCAHLSGLVSLSMPVPVALLHDAPAAPARSAFTFFPEQPQRPPRA